MTLERWARWTPLTGVLFVVLVIAGGPVLAGSTPGARASSASVIAFYSAHRGRERAAAIVLALSFVAFLFFAGTLRARLRRRPGAEGLAALVLAAASVLVVGQSANEGVTYALTEAPGRLSPAAAQVLNLLQNDLVLTSAIGFLAFGLTAGLAIVRAADLPAWLGVSVAVIGILFVVPPIEFAGFILLLVWVLTASVILLRRDAPAPAAPPALAADPAA
jgi:hypothetical protein